jgi:hypothetical protein
MLQYTWLRQGNTCLIVLIGHVCFKNQRSTPKFQDEEQVQHTLDHAYGHRKCFAYDYICTESVRHHIKRASSCFGLHRASARHRVCGSYAKLVRIALLVIISSARDGHVLSASPSQPLGRFMLHPWIFKEPVA